MLKPELQFNVFFLPTNLLSQPSGFSLQPILGFAGVKKKVFSPAARDRVANGGTCTVVLSTDPGIHTYIYIPGKLYGHVFCPLWVLPVTDVFLVQLRILVFDCEGLFKYI